ncbi:MAG: hypothetical protein J5J00_11305 [Deltaproteobacteria bacterium]|nr:hypothetical protein [Deltaproteobacteria bacterium]
MAAFGLFFAVAQALLPNELLADRKGRVISSMCPFSCQSVGMKGDSCNEWRAGDRCYVRIFTDDDGRQSEPSVRPTNTPKPVATAPSGKEKRASRWSPEQLKKIKQRENLVACERIHSRYQIKPQIKLNSNKDAGYLKQGRYVAKIMISGMCLRNAGYFEDGKLIQPLEIPISTQYGTYSFTVTYRVDAKPEIRLYPISGTRIAFKLAPESK